MRRPGPDLSLLDGIVAPQVLNAMRRSADQLSRLGVRHWIVGGLAVGAHGHPRATKDVDFLVGDEAFERHGGGLVTMKPGVPIEVEGVIVDHLSARGDEAFLTAPLPAASETLQVAPAEVLVYLKLKSPRAKDRADIIELIKAGIDVEACRAYLTKNSARYVPDFEAAVATARAEENEE